MKKRITVGTKSVGASRSGASVGYVSLPDNISREDYILRCFNTSRIFVRNESGESIEVFIDEEKIKQVKFPEKSNERGSVVFWINVEKHNQAICFSVSNLTDDYNQLNSENVFYNKKTKDNVIVETKIDADNGNISLSVIGDKDKGSIDISVINPNDKGLISLRVAGKLYVFSTSGIDMQTKTDISMRVVDKDHKSLSHISYKEDEKWRIFGDSESAGEWSVLGETNLDMIGKLIDEIESVITNIKSLTVPTSVGPSGVPINASSFTINGNNLEQIKEDFKNILSKNVKID